MKVLQINTTFRNGGSTGRIAYDLMQVHKEEGIGFVALEAAVYGAEIVLTDIGAPKEYYDGRAELVSPYDVDAIGQAVCKLMSKGKSQPELRQHILNNYSFDILSKYLHNTLLTML